MKQFWTLLLVTGALAQGQILSPAWVEVGEGGRAIARVVVQSEDCPTAQIDGTGFRMTLRLPVPEGFRPVCEQEILANAKSATVNGQELAFTRHARMMADETYCRDFLDARAARPRREY